MLQVKDTMPFEVYYAKVLAPKSAFLRFLSHVFLFLVVLHMPKF